MFFVCTWSLLTRLFRFRCPLYIPCEQSWLLAQRTHSKLTTDNNMQACSFFRASFRPHHRTALVFSRQKLSNLAHILWRSSKDYTIEGYGWTCRETVATREPRPRGLTSPSLHRAKDMCTRITENVRQQKCTHFPVQCTLIHLFSRLEKSAKVHCPKTITMP